MTDSVFPTGLDTALDEATLAAATFAAVDGVSQKMSSWMRKVDSGLTAIETKLGITSSADVNSVDYRLASALSYAQDVKDACRVATTANITLSGTQTIDGVAVVANDRVLVKNQTTGANNGIYVCASGAWSRATDADISAEVTSGMSTFVTSGTVNASTGWIVTTANPITLGTTSLTFAQFGTVSLPLSVANGGTANTTAAAAFAALSPITTKGDLIVTNGTTETRLPVGTNTQVLTADSAQTNGLKWATPSAVANWSAVPVWIAAYGSSTTYTDHATYTCLATGPTDSANVTADTDAIAVYAALGPVIFCPGTYYLETNLSNGVHASLFVYPNCPVSALLPGTVTIKWATNVVTGLAANPGVWCVVANASAGSTSSDDNIDITGIIFDANVAGQGTGTHDVFNCCYFSRVSNLRLTRCHFKNARGTGGSTTSGGPYEKWNIQIYRSKGMVLEDVETSSDNKAVYGATGIGIQYSSIGVINRCRAHDNKYHGMNNHSSAQLRYSDCHTYLNNLAGTLCEYGRDILYVNCVFGGESNHQNAQWDTINTSWGNGSYGIAVQGGDHIQLTNCASSWNGSDGYSFQASTDATEGPGLNYQVTCANITASNNTGKNLNLINGAGPKTKIVGFHFSSAGSNDIYNNIYSGGWTLTRPTGGVIASSRTPAVPAASATTTNDHPFTVLVHAAGGVATNLTVDGVALGTGVTTAAVEPGGTVGLGAYTGSPTWRWTIAA